MYAARLAKRHFGVPRQMFSKRPIILPPIAWKFRYPADLSQLPEPESVGPLTGHHIPFSRQLGQTACPSLALTLVAVSDKAL